jgi:AraC family transcriptional regulator of adaptative response / DNA-3-methyladenine glycosylase II
MLLLETTELPIVEVAFAAGFTSLRQFNVSVRGASGCSPREIRAGRDLWSGVGPGSVQLRLPFRAPHDTAALLRFLGARAIPGVEQVRADSYIRSLRLPHGTGVMRIGAGVTTVHAHFALQDMRDLAAAVTTCHHLLDLESDPKPILDRLGDDPLIGGLVNASPGRRVPGTVDPNELAVRAVLGQQVTLKAAVKLGACLVSAYGDALQQPDGDVSHVFPTVERIAEAGLNEIPMPQARRQALRKIAQWLGTHALDGRSLQARDGVDGRLLALPGIGPWTAGYIAMRALRDPDVFLANDAGVRRAMNLLGVSGTPQQLERVADGWRPYRASAVQHLWALDAKESWRDQTRVAA